MSAEDNINLWEEHLRGEFLTKNHHESLATMVDGASVYTLPTGWGATGKASLGPLYRDEFIPSIPPDWRHTLLNRVATENCIAEEARIQFHHTQRMDWFLPGVPPTGKEIDVTFIIFVDFRDGKMAAERIYWDHAAVLRQAGLLK